ncbi:hypothetical protein BKA60DRAFT_653725 [Fusarium oxysporum]|nr:hypothetical protein BKA60DRAFT_653725 [Fusarium oxysporum]
MEDQTNTLVLQTHRRVTRSMVKNDVSDTKVIKVEKRKTAPRKVPTGVVLSASRIPPISKDRFGLIQETVGRDLYKLLVAAVLWNRTRGFQARPVFQKLISRYPTPTHLAEACFSDLADLIRPIGLYNSRAARFIAFAKTWLEKPPNKSRRYRKLHYPLQGDGLDIGKDEVLDEDDVRQGWEVAHLPSLGPDPCIAAVKNAEALNNFQFTKIILLSPRKRLSETTLRARRLLGHFVLAGFIPKPPPYIVPGPNVKPTSNLPPMPHDLYGEPDWAHSWHQPKDEIEAVRQLDLDIQQIGLSPIIIRARLKNAGPYHVRFWGPGSPITMKAIEYGLFKIYADQLKWNFGEATQEREEKHKGLHMDDDTIVKLNPYMVIERDFVLPGNSQTNVSWHKMLENAKKVNRYKMQDSQSSVFPLGYGFI